MHLKTEVNSEDVKDNLNEGKGSGLCFETMPKYSSYKIFKMGISPDLSPKVLSSEFRPSGILTGKFVQNKV